MHVKKGDKVIVKKGKDKGQTGLITHAFPKENKVIVEGLNMVKRRTKPRKQGEKGKVIEISQPIHVSNVALAGGQDKEKIAPPKKKTAKPKKSV